MAVLLQISPLCYFRNIPRLVHVPKRPEKKFIRLALEYDRYLASRKGLSYIIATLIRAINYGLICRE